MFHTETFVVRSYSLMMLIAAMTAILTTAWRAHGRKDVNANVLFLMLPTAILGGWIASGVAVTDGAALRMLWHNLSPFTRKGHTVTFFCMGACLAMAPILIFQGRAAFAYLDVLAPSFPLGFAFAKLGCFLAGCCAGALCAYPFAVTYPYGSECYKTQWQAGLLAPPSALILDEADRPQRLLGHAQSLRLARSNPPEFAVAHAQKHGVTFDELALAASKSRSLGVWPIQLIYILAATVLWVASEALFRKSAFPGATIAFVLAGYGLMRITFDFFVQEQGPLLLRLTVPQWSGVLALIMAVPLGITGWRLARINL